MIGRTMTGPTPPPAINWEAVGAIVAILTLIFSLMAAGITRIFNLGKVSSRLSAVESNVKDIKKDLSDTRKDITKRIDDLMTSWSQRGLSEAQSPRRLNAEGRKVLKNSGIDKVVEEKFDELVKMVQSKKSSNSYQAQQEVLSAVRQLINEPGMKDTIEKGAFKSGYDVGAVLFVGGLYIRDKVLETLNFKVDDIDIHTPEDEK